MSPSDEEPYITITERAKRLIEALHELHSLDARWMIAQSFLDEEREEVRKQLEDAE